MVSAIPDQVLSLFPELADPDDVLALLDAVSGAPSAWPPPSGHGADALAGVAVDTVYARSDATLDDYGHAIAAEARRKFVAVVERHPSAREHRRTLVDDQIHDLAHAITRKSTRCLVAALHVLVEHGRLHGASGEERFQHFATFSTTAAFRTAVRHGFPQWAADTDRLVDTAIARFSEILARFEECQRSGALEPLGVGASAQISAFETTAGDRHADGRSVVIVHLDHHRQLVYKPRPMAVEVALSEFTRRFAEHSGADLARLVTVDGGEFGWQEFADGDRGTDASGYYVSCGHLLAILHLLRATDMHFENVGSHRGRPVPIDAETLFSGNERRSAVVDRADPAARAMADSVFSTGFLPTRVQAGPDAARSIDVGFLGYEPGQEAITAIPVPMASGSDAMRVGFGYGEMLTTSARPSGSAGGVRQLRWVLDGFESSYRWIMAHRSLVRTWMRELFGHVPVRVVACDTRQYTQLLTLATHPQFQESAELSNILFHRVGIGRVEHATPAVVRAEVRDLQRGDVPVFRVWTDDVAVVDWSGERLADVLAAPPLETACGALDAMDDERLALALEHIRGSYIGTVAQEDDQPGWAPEPVRPPGAVRPSVVPLIRRLVDQFARSAVRGDDGIPAQWIGPTVTDTSVENPWRFRALGSDLYAGSTGIGLFLAAAGVRLGDEATVDLAESVLVPTGRRLLDAERRADFLEGGIAGGFPGIAYALLAGGALVGRADWLTLGRALWRRVPEVLPTVSPLDLLGGGAGLLLVADQIPDLRVREQVADVVIHAVDELLQGPSRRVYSGFAHGLAGLITAVGGTHDPRLRGRVDGLKDRYDQLFGGGLERWGMVNEPEAHIASGWCHGLPGMLLAESLRWTRGETERAAELDRLIDAVRERCFDLNLTLCHGDLGNLLLLRRAARCRGRNGIETWVSDRFADLTEHVVPAKLADPVGKTMQNTSLMVGVAGLGFGLLAAEESMPLPDLFTLGIA